MTQNNKVRKEKNILDILKKNNCPFFKNNEIFSNLL